MSGNSVQELSSIQDSLPNIRARQLSCTTRPWRPGHSSLKYFQAAVISSFSHISRASNCCLAVYPIMKLAQTHFLYTPTYLFSGVCKSLFRAEVPFFDGVLAIHSAFSDAAVAVVEIIGPGAIVEFSRCGNVGALVVAHKSPHSGGVRLCF